MKKIIIILLVACSFSSCKKENYTDVANTSFAEEMFVGKWNVSYLDAGFALKVGDLFLFNSDGTYSVIYSNYTVQDIWRLKENTFTVNKIIYNSRSTTPNIFNIVKINSKELILSNSNYKIKFLKSN